MLIGSCWGTVGGPGVRSGVWCGMFRRGGGGATPTGVLMVGVVGNLSWSLSESLPVHLNGRININEEGTGKAEISKMAGKDGY